MSDPDNAVIIYRFSWRKGNISSYYPVFTASYRRRNHRTVRGLIRCVRLLQARMHCHLENGGITVSRSRFALDPGALDSKLDTFSKSLECSNVKDRICIMCLCNIAELSYLDLSIIHPLNTDSEGAQAPKNCQL